MDLAVIESPLEHEDFLVIDIERFQGPLDLLLHLIRQQDIDVFEIPVARITRQFLVAVEGIEVKDLDNAGEFIEMAAGLIHIKAQMLLPRQGETEQEDPRAELVRRLLEYEQIRDVSHLLASAEAERARRFGKGFLEPRPRPPTEETPLESTWDDVFAAVKACHEAVHAKGAPRITTTIKVGTRVDREQTMEEKVASVRVKLS